MKAINFNNAKKQFLTVTLPDEKNTILMVGTPTKAIMNDLILLQSSLEAMNDDGANMDAMDDLYNACAKIMSRNRAGVTITKDHLEAILDFEDIIIFFNAYMEFISEVTGGKN